MTNLDDTGFDPTADDLFIEPPKWPKVVGILSIIFGGISASCGTLSTLATPFQGAMLEGQLNGDPLPPGMDFNPVTLSLGLGSAAINLLLVIAGVMLINRKAVARTLHLVYALLFIPVLVLAVIVGFKQQEAMQVWAEEYPSNVVSQSMKKQADMGVNISLIFGLVMILISMVWPLFCILWFGFIKTKPHKMTGEPEEQDAGMTS